MKRVYYTLEDLVKFKFDEWPEELDIGELPEVVENENFLVSLIDSYHPDILTEGSVVKNNKSNILFCRYIAPRFKDMYVNYTDSDLEEDYLYKYFIRYFVLKLNFTFLKYAKLIDIYDGVKDALMEDIKRSNEVKFNDTPQNVQGSSYDWSDDDHLTNVTRTEIIDPVTTKIARLAEVESIIKDYYTQWANEFKEIFIYD